MSIGLYKVSKKYPSYSDFTKKPSFQFTSFKSQLKDHQEEFRLRKIHKISSAHWLEPKDIKEKFGSSLNGQENEGQSNQNQLPGQAAQADQNDGQEPEGSRPK